MTLQFEGEVIYWRGPAPYFFIRVPEDESQQIKQVALRVSYGWGVVPVNVLIGGTQFTTSLIPRQGIYLLPVKDMVRRQERISEGDSVLVTLEIAG